MPVRFQIRSVRLQEHSIAAPDLHLFLNQYEIRSGIQFQFLVDDKWKWSQFALRVVKANAKHQVDFRRRLMALFCVSWATKRGTFRQNSSSALN